MSDHLESTREIPKLESAPTDDPVPELLRLLGRPVVFIDWPRGVKGSQKRWKHLRYENMTALYLKNLRHGNIGVALGDVSGGLCAIDIDSDGHVQTFVNLNPVLSQTLQTHGNRGRVFWLRFKGNFPRKSSKLKTANGEIGEFRSNGNQSIVWGTHPDTKRPYQFVVRKPATALDYGVIKWPAEILDPPSLQSRTESTEVIGISRSIESYSVNRFESYSVNSINEAVEISLPTAPRRNNRALFTLARALLSLGECSVQDRMTAFDLWFNQTEVKGFLRQGQSREHYFHEFMNAIKTAKHPMGRSPIQVAWERVKTEILPKEADFFDAEEARQLVALCYQLEQSSNSEPWYLSCRDAEKLINKSHTVCARWLSDFVVLGILQVVTPGTKHKATRYTWKGACK